MVVVDKHWGTSNRDSWSRYSSRWMTVEWDWGLGIMCTMYVLGIVVAAAEAALVDGYGDVYICWAIYQWLNVIRIKLGTLKPE